MSRPVHLWATKIVTGFGKTLHKAALTFWYHIKGLVPENTVIPKPKPCSVPFQSYGCFKNDFCIHVNGDVNIDKHVHENMFTSLVEGFPKTGHNFTHLCTPNFISGQPKFTSWLP